MKKDYKKPIILSSNISKPSFFPAIVVAAEAAAAAASAVVARKAMRGNIEDDKKQKYLNPILG